MLNGTFYCRCLIKFVKSLTLNYFPSSHKIAKRCSLGTAEIHANTDSESDILFTFKDEKTANVKDLVPFQSNHGLYVRLRKPLDQGVFKFNYGVFEEAKEKNIEEPHGRKLYKNRFVPIIKLIKITIKYQNISYRFFQ